ncbi:MAG: pseudouridine synthase [Rhodocyclaceae bacterium]|jgi:tRNA pseudouridine65 synthase|nr:pseudouridine synthase [Rhodocyclaceae bacterium]
MLTLLYRDEHLVAIDKPPGMLVHRSDLDRHETRFAVQLLRDQLGRRVTPVHRLDKGTSGVLLFAFDPAIVRVMAEQFESGAVEKTYLAVVRGWPPETGVIDHALTRKFDAYGRQLPTAEAQPAITHYRRLATVELPVCVDRYPTSRYALVELTPLTGRQHQLRRHLKHIGHPIIGDATHGKGMHNRFFQREFGCGRLLLACVGLSFRHPVSGEKVCVGGTAGDQFDALIARFDWSQAAAPAPAARPLAKQAVSR